MQKNGFRKAAVCAVCIICIIALSGCSFFGIHIGKRPPEPSVINVPGFPTTPAFPDASGTGLPEYEHYDSSEFLADCEEMLRLYEAGKTEESFSLYTELGEELLTMDEMQSIAYVKYSENVNDEYYSDEYDYMDETMVNASDAFFTVCHQMITGAYSSDFTAFLNDDKYISEYQDYEPMDTDQLELFSKENDLIRQYYSQADTLMDTSCTIGGKEYTFEDVIGDNAYELYNQDSNLYMEVYETCLKKYNALVGETFLELVDVRTKIAASYGYDSYADYADEKDYKREYTVSDLEVMKKAVKGYGGDMQYLTSVFTDESDFYYADSSELVTKVGTILKEISPLVSESFDYFWDNQLFSIGEESERMDGGYTIYLSKSIMPYIFAKTDGSAQNAITLAHEFGHFTAFHEVPMPYPLLDSGSLDLEETHSQGLQLLFTERADSLFKSDADNIRSYNVMRVLSAVLDGCVLDDWQREVYANPGMTLDEINDLFKRIEIEYGSDDYTGLEYLWCDISHNFESPMYYVSYAVSALGALQIWALSQKNFDSAVSAWESLIEQGPYTEDYFSVMKNAGLKTFDEPNAAKDILGDAISYLYRAYQDDSFSYFGNY